MITHLVSTVLLLVVCITGVITPMDIEARDGVLVANFCDMGLFQLNGIVYGGFSEHEIGHSIQQRRMEDEEYYFCVAVPSVLSNVVYVVGYPVKLYRYVDHRKMCFEVEAENLAREFYYGK
jgi:hypothetical protein